MTSTIGWFVPQSLADTARRLTGIPPWHPNHSLASVWIRGYQLGQHLRERGHHVACNPLIPRGLDVAIFLRRYGQVDVHLAKMLKGWGTKIVTDAIVDYRTSKKPETEDKWEKNPQSQSFDDLLELSDEVWCVSSYLQESISETHPNVVHIPDSVDSNHFRRTDGRDTGSTLRFGWSGYSVKAGPLNLLKPWVEREEIELLVISDQPPPLDFNYEYEEWSYDRFPSLISSCDLCVAPREIDDGYTKGHSAFKIAVFMAMGVPALASPVPSYETVLRKDHGGAICETPADWRYWIERFLSEPLLRERWSKEAKKAVEPHLTSQVCDVVENRLSDLTG